MLIKINNEVTMNHLKIHSTAAQELVTLIHPLFSKIFKH